LSTLGLLGAYSIDNAGDALLGYAARTALARIVPGAELRLYAPRMAGRLWGHEFSARRGLGARVRETTAGWEAGLDAVVVGGGGLLAAGPAFAPFRFADETTRGLAAPAAWNAVCAQGERGEEPAYLAELAAACERLAYVSVRNRATERLLRRAGWGGEIAVVPDAALGLDVVADGSGRRLLDELGIEPGRFVVGVSAGNALADARAAGFFADLLASIGGLPDVAVVVFPFGRVYGDDRVARAAAERIPGSRLVTRDLDPLERVQLIAALDFHVCARMHAMVAALVTDTPFVVADEYLRDAEDSKIREIIVDAALEERHLRPYSDERPGDILRARVAEARSGATSFAALRAGWRERLDRHYRDMLAALGVTG
jgi:polysaccharide pyruvyl transferase WcaK-like protein